MPKVQQKHYDKEALVSSYSNQFKKPEVRSEFTHGGGPVVPVYEYKPKKAEFYSDTEYKKSFDPKPV